MKTLVVYYSRTGTTKKLAEDLAEHFNADKEEILDLTSREGAINWLKAGRDAFKKRTTEISKTKKDPSKYDLVLLGSPTWAGNITPAMRMYVRCNKDKFGHVACFCTMGGNKTKNIYKDFTYELGKDPIHTFSSNTKDVINNIHKSKIKVFSKELKNIKKITNTSGKKK
ncbi:MAG: flavodoxin [Candidatus Pacearchaeota archaeon]|jgi:flavodoxin